jgi:hypothetical protein
MEVTIGRELDHEFRRMYYTFGTIAHWQRAWRVICDMAYDSNAIQYETITIHSDDSDREDARAYGGYTVQNQHLICLDEVWRSYDKKAPFVNKTLKQVYVPRVLFNCLGVQNWFKFSFPNCEVHYWPE